MLIACRTCMIKASSCIAQSLGSAEEHQPPLQGHGRRQPADQVH